MANTINTIDIFAEEVAKAIHEKTGIDVTVNKVTKNNNVELTSLLLREEGSNIAPTIYLETPFEESHGIVTDDLIDRIIAMYKEAKIDESEDFDFFTDFDQVRDRLKMKLISSR